MLLNAIVLSCENTEMETPCCGKFMVELCVQDVDVKREVYRGAMVTDNPLDYIKGDELTLIVTGIRGIDRRLYLRFSPVGCVEE